MIADTFLQNKLTASDNWLLLAISDAHKKTRIKGIRILMDQRYSKPLRSVVKRDEVAIPKNNYAPPSHGIPSACSWRYDTTCPWILASRSRNLRRRRCRRCSTKHWGNARAGQAIAHHIEEPTKVEPPQRRTSRGRQSTPGVAAAPGSPGRTPPRQSRSLPPKHCCRCTRTCVAEERMQNLGTSSNLILLFLPKLLSIKRYKPHK
jgi:hypothetical protein